MKVNEIFYSIDGEGLRAGELAIFIRLAGCNLSCSYCDTDYAQGLNQGYEMSPAEILGAIRKYHCQNITLTGGEPLIHLGVKDLVDTLLKHGYYVNIETNGSVDISNFLKENILITMDYKLPSSNQSMQMLDKNLKKLRKSDVLKFVAGNEDDLNFAKEIISKNDIKSYIYFSPVHEQMELKQIVDFMKKNKFSRKTRLQIQLHKVIWNPNERGV